MDIASLPMMILKGLFIGVICSAPCGPVGVLCIQRVLKKGFIYGIMTGIGAVTSDTIYALLSGYGMTFVTDFIRNENNKLVMQLLGSALLLIFGIYMLLSHPHGSGIQLSKDKGLTRNALTAFLLTFSNPLIILLFLVLFARFDFIRPDLPVNTIVGYVAMVVGAMTWWFVLSFVINKIRNTFSPKYIRVLNVTLGGVVIAAALVGFFFTITGLHTGLHWY